eukprot:TRINITY_DN1874_c0_g1_i1.p1 TRINITY_DN1874_c0_g1~~TRINITY_DN1874_c0_g1_i1.p1  ORF type:complete len:250 (-),score=1.97 TRINITY_DN1874_c0_g1_i1:92-841(-)
MYLLLTMTVDRSQRKCDAKSDWRQRFRALFIFLSCCILCTILLLNSSLGPPSVRSLWNILHVGVPLHRSMDTMVILGFTLTPQPSPQNWTTTPILEDRLRLGIHLFERNVSSNIVLSGGWGTRKSQALAMERWMITHGPPPLPTPWLLIPEGRSNTTYQNALFTAEIVQDRGYRSLAVVTSSFHQFRSRLTFCTVFKRMGLDHVKIVAAKMEIDEFGLEPVSGFYHFVRELGAIAMYLVTNQMSLSACR